jgi:WD40 repeat protein
MHGTVVTVGQMTRAQLRAVSEGPLPEGGSSEPGLVERILDDIGDDPATLALLEFALTLLWQRQDRGQLTHAAYGELGGVRGAMAQYAEQVYQQLDPPERELARRVLVQLVRPSDTAAPVRRVARRPDLGEDGWRLGQRLAAARLLVADRDATGVETLELVHEALIGGWTRLHDWAEHDRLFRSWQERLRQDVSQWDQTGRDRGALLRGVPLAEAQRWLAERPHDIPAAEHEFIRAGTALQGRSVRRLRAVAAALSLLLIATCGLVVFAVRQARQEAAQARLDRARLLVDQAERVEGSQPDLAMLLAVAAYRTARTDDTTALVTRLATKHWHLTRLLNTGRVTDLAFDPKRPAVLAAAGPDTLTLWDVDRATVRHSTRVQAHAVQFVPAREAVAFADGATEKTRIRLWRLDDGRITTIAAGVDLPTRRFTIDPTGNRLAACAVDGIAVWRIGSPPSQRPARIRLRQPSNDCSFGFTNAGRNLVYTDGLYVVKWSLARETQISRVRASTPVVDGGTPSPVSLAVSSDGRTAVVSVEGRAARWWDVSGNPPLIGGPVLNGYSYGAEFSADGRHAMVGNTIIVDADSKRAVRRLPVREERSGFTTVASPALGAGAQSVAVPLGYRVGIVTVPRLPAAFTQADVIDVGAAPGPNQVTVLTRDGDVSVWNTDPPGVVANILNGGGPPSSGSKLYPADLSGDGSAMAELRGKRLAVWDVRTRRRLPTPRLTDPAAVTALGFDHAGEYLAASDNETLTLWRTTDGRRVDSARLPVVYEQPTIAVTSGGRYVSIGSEWEDVRPLLWKIGAGQAPRTTTAAAPNNAPPAFSPDGRLIGIPDADGVTVQDLATGTTVRRLPGQGPILFSIDGGRMTTRAIDDPTLSQHLVWDLRQGTVMGSVHGGEGVLTFTRRPDLRNSQPRVDRG